LSNSSVAGEDFADMVADFDATLYFGIHVKHQVSSSFWKTDSQKQTVEEVWIKGIKELS